MFGLQRICQDISYTLGYRNPLRTSVPAHSLHANIVRPALNTQPIQLNKYIPQCARRLRKPALESFASNPYERICVYGSVYVFMDVKRQTSAQEDKYMTLCVWYGSMIH